MADLKALLIDSDSKSQSVLNSMLTEAGFSVDLSTSGYTALSKTKQQVYDLVCCSHHSLDISAIELCSQLRANSRYDYVQIIIISSDETPINLKQALLAGATDVIFEANLTELNTFLSHSVERQVCQLSGRVLLIEDSRVLQEIITDLVTDMGLDIDSYTHAEDAWQAFNDSPYDLIVTDIMLEGAMSGITLVRKIVQHTNRLERVPVIATSGFESASRKIELFRLGVNDFISKPIIREELKQRIYNNILNYQRLVELKKQQSALNSLAVLDPSTNLLTRHALRQFSTTYFVEAQRSERSLSLAVLDIDNFSQINQSFGYGIGDKILREFASWLRRLVRLQDLVARWGSNQFIALFTGYDSAAAYRLTEKIQQQLKNYHPAGITLTLSIGIATAEHGKSFHLNELVDLADSAMYQAKLSGRNCIKIYSDDKSSLR